MYTLAIMKFQHTKIIFFALYLLIACGHPLSAQPLRIAVAANAQSVIKKLQADFKKKTGIESEIIIGASGKLSTQIINGAPFDIFLSADTAFPNQLYQKGFGLQKPKIYALGSLIVCGTNSQVMSWQKYLVSSDVKKVSIANPKTAPYGKAAEEALRFYQLTDQVSSKLIFAESISTVNTYLQTGAVDIGFTTEAFLYELVDKSHLKWARVDQKSYGKIYQSVILLTHAKGKNRKVATLFYDYLSSDSAKKIFAKSGYHVPKN